MASRPMETSRIPIGGAIPREPETRSASLIALIPAGLAAALSAWLASSWDEVYWIAVVRKLAHGGRLYDTVIDNKGPLWYPIVTVAEALPFPFAISRAVLVFACSLAIFLLADTVLKRKGIAASDRRPLASVVVILVTLFSLFHLTTELFSAVAILAALAQVRHPFRAGVAIIAALLIDPRTALLVPGVWLHIVETPLSSAWREGRRAMVTLGAATGAGILPYFLLPDLRYAVIEIGQATRVSVVFSPTEALIVLAAAVVPLLTAHHLVGRPAGLGWSAPATFFALGALLIALASFAPFPHYWTYLPLALVIAGPADQRKTRLHDYRKVLVFASLLPMLALALVEDRDDRQLERIYNTALSAVGPLDSDRRVVVFSGDPHPVAAIAGQALGSSPVSFYLGMETSRQARYRQEFRDDLEQADTIWVTAPGELTEESPIPRLADEWEIIKDHLPSFPCRTAVFPLLAFEREQPGGGCDAS